MQGIFSKLLCVKLADADADLAAIKAIQNNELKQEALRHVGGTALAGLGLGAAARGVIGLSQLAASNARARKKRVGINSEPTDLDLPFIPPEPIKTAETKGLFTGILNQAERDPEPVNDLDNTAKHKEWEGFRQQNRGAQGRLLGDNSSTRIGIPWYMPLTTLGAGLGLYGGYKATDALLEKRKKTETEDELSEAKNKYRNAIMSQYTPDQVEKWSSASVDQGLDILFDAAMKRVNGEFNKIAVDLNNLLGTGLGGYGVIATGLALGTGIGTYKYIKSRSPEERLKKVLQQRQRERWLRSPPEYQVTSQQVPVTAPKPAEEHVD